MAGVGCGSCSCVRVHKLLYLYLWSSCLSPCAPLRLCSALNKIEKKKKLVLDSPAARKEFRHVRLTPGRASCRAATALPLPALCSLPLACLEPFLSPHP